MNESNEFVVGITALFTYPIKSCRAVAAESLRIENFGPRWDRRWMIVDAVSGRFLTQREWPQMTQIAPDVNEADGMLRVSAPGHAPLEIALEIAAETTGASRTVQVWKDTVLANDCGDEAATWFSEVLETDCRLVYAPPNFARPGKPTYSLPENRVAFADGFPMVLASEESLDDLNRRIHENSGCAPVPMDRFRPNLVVRGAEPWAEDNWKTLVTEDGARLTVAKSCTRCAITTIDQITGAKTGAEPLATLATFRRGWRGKVRFAQNLVPDADGLPVTLQIGETLRVQVRAAKG